jgi:two-component system sensor histidine kinase KdpD
MMTPAPARTTSTQRIAASRWKRAAAIAVLLAAATALSWAVDDALSHASQALIYLLPVVLSAVYLRGVDSIVTAVLGAVLLNFLFIPPRYTFEVEGPEYLLSLTVLLGVSLLVNALVTQLKRETAAARLGEARMAALHELGQVLAPADSEARIAELAAATIAAALALPIEVRIIGAGGMQVRCGAPADLPFQADDDAIKAVLDRRKALGRGTTNWPALDYCVVPLSADGGAGIGALAVDLRAVARPWDADDVRHLEALGRVVAEAAQRRRLTALAQDAAAEARLEGTRSALLASISHDLRTPLAVIVGSASTLREQGGAMTPERRESLLQTIESEAAQMTTIAENALQMARLSAGPLALRRDWESMEEIIGSVAARIRRRHRGCALAVRVPPGLPLVKVDAVLVAQLLNNLIENALNHAPGSDAIEIEAERLGDRIEIRVSDRGPGIGAIDPERLFVRRTGNTDTGRPTRGAGLGLAICRAIVQAHGGTITAENRAGGGATFRFTLPVTDTVPDLPAEPEAASQ